MMKKHRYGRWLAILILGLAGLGLPASAAMGAHAQAGPAVTITSPAPGATLPAGNVTVNIAIQNFQIVLPGAPNAPGQGHIHYYLDVAIPTTPGIPAVTPPGTYLPSQSTSAVWANVPAGMHSFGVQLVNSDHTPLQPPATATVSVTLTATALAGGPQPGAPQTTNWGLIGGMVPALAALGLVIYFVRRQPSE